MKIRLKSFFFIFCTLMFCGTSTAYSQNVPKQKLFTIEKGFILTKAAIENDFQVAVAVKQLPKPHPGVDEQVVNAAKLKNEQFRIKRSLPLNQKTTVADSLVLLRNFAGNGFNGHVPNDNDVAVSNGDIVCSVSNTTIHSVDQSTGTVYGSFVLHSITSGLGLQQEEFDPKVIYDPDANRFVMVCLNGFTDTTSNILVGFSQDTTSFGNWNFYALPGNPLNNNLWTDFPMMAVNDNYLFITVNLLTLGSPWQTGFNETIIWQIPKSEGYSGTTINPVLHYNIWHNGEPIRNLCPVKGGTGIYGPDFYFLSNRNFAATNDTVFLVTMPPGANPTPVVQALVAPEAYHMPVNADQTHADKLQVNDARFLGAFIENNMLQAVASSIDTVSGNDGIYHLKISDPGGTPVLQSTVMTQGSLDIAYPNIAYAGLSPSSNAAVISILQSASNVHPGCGAVYADDAGDYSSICTVYAGTGYTNMLIGTERWGDYTGCQTRYNMPGHVWVNGSYSIQSHTTRTWIGEVVPSSISGVNVPESRKNPPVLYPNPAAADVHVDFDLKEAGEVQLGIYDMNGKQIALLYRGSLKAGPNSFTFTSAHLAKGIYAVTVTHKNELLGTVQLVKE